MKQYKLTMGLPNSNGKYKAGEMIDVYCSSEIKEMKNLQVGAESYVSGYEDDDEIIGFAIYDMDVNGDLDFIAVDICEVEPQPIDTNNTIITGDVVQLRNGKHLVYINNNLGYVALENVLDNSNVTENFSVKCFNDYKHFIDKGLDIIKVYRTQDILNQEILDSVKNGSFSVIYEEQKQYYTLEEASKFSKKMKHKDCTYWSDNNQDALYEAIDATGKDLFEVLKLKEFEVEE